MQAPNTDELSTTPADLWIQGKADGTHENLSRTYNQNASQREVGEVSHVSGAGCRNHPCGTWRRGGTPVCQRRSRTVDGWEREVEVVPRTPAWDGEAL